MRQPLADLLQLLQLERLEMNLFRGESRDIGSPQVYGGQVLGQALMAASATVEERHVHSLHAYFLRRGDFNAPIVYEVDRSRDGKSFTSRRVVAIQHGQQIFHMSASFQVDEPGPQHQVFAPDVPPPEQLVDLRTQLADRLGELPEAMRRFFGQERPFEYRPVEPWDTTGPRPAERHTWFRVSDPLPDDQTINRCLLAYISDYQLLETASLPHGLSWRRGEVTMASIDHAMWFHRPVPMNDWFLYVTRSPSASGSRGLAIGSIYDREGCLVATAAQEGLLRVRVPRATT
jgi:acyl-CoA thioesterase-2